MPFTVQRLNVLNIPGFLASLSDSELYQKVILERGGFVKTWTQAEGGESEVLGQPRLHKT